MRKGTWGEDLEEQRKPAMEMSEVSLGKGACRGPEAGCAWIGSSGKGGI